MNNEDQRAIRSILREELDRMLRAADERIARRTKADTKGELDSKVDLNLTNKKCNS